MHAEPEDRVTQATRGDPRITPVGRFLRRTSLDELPQFFNVLQGRVDRRSAAPCAGSQPTLPGSGGILHAAS